MSKTDKTAPFWVKMMRGDIASEELHNHADGVCDLPPENLGPTYRTGQRCRRVFVYTGVHVCCCHWCHSCDEFMVRPGKRQRLDGKTACRTWEDDYEDWASEGLNEYGDPIDYENHDWDELSRLWMRQPEASRYLRR